MPAKPRAYRPPAGDDAGRPSLFDFGARTLREIIDWYLDQPEALGTDEASRTERKRNLTLFKAQFGDWPLTKARPALLPMFINSPVGPRGKDGGPASAWTRKRWASAILSAFNLAVKHGLIDRNPLAGIKMPQGEDGRDMKEEEFRALLLRATPVYRRVLMFMRETGARPGEVRAVRVGDVFLDDRLMVLEKHKTRAKTRRARKVVLTERAVKLLRWLIPRAGPEGHLFVNSFNRPWTIGALCKNLRQIRAKAGLPKDVKNYGCRHAFGTRGIEAGLSTATVAELLGHSGLATAQRYIHLADKKQHLHDAVDKAAGRKKSGPAPGEGKDNPAS
jgi:integrase